MLVSELTNVTSISALPLNSIDSTEKKGHPYVNEFMREVLDVQFLDVRAMLQLPRPEMGIRPACNYAIVSSLTNLISGISTTIYKPHDFLHEEKSRCGSGRAFKELIRDFFPYLAHEKFAEDLYNLARNPMAHSAALMDAGAPKVVFTRILDPSHPDVGWSNEELDDLENPLTPFSFPHDGIVIERGIWTLHCDAFYLDVIRMLRRLTADEKQMNAAESRLANSVYNWRIR